MVNCSNTTPGPHFEARGHHRDRDRVRTKAESIGPDDPAPSTTKRGSLFGNVQEVNDGDRGAGAPMTGLSHVQLLVSDVGASAQWYSLALGLESYVEDLDIGYVALRHRLARVVIVLTSDGDRVTPEIGQRAAANDGSEGPSGRLDHLAFAVPDGDALHAWADHLTEIGIDHGPVVLENGNPSLQLRDPDGIAIELVAPGSGTSVAAIGEIPAPGRQP